MTQAAALLGLVALAGCRFFTSLDDYASGSAGASSEGGDGGLPGGGGSSGASGGDTGGSGGQCSGACVAPCQACGGDPDACLTNTASDPNHCGQCGRSCQGGPCIGGRCQPLLLAEARGLPSGIAVDDRIYWLEQGSNSTGKVVAANKDGTSLVELASALDSPLNLVLDGDAIFFTFFTGGGGLARVDKSGANFEKLLASSGAWSIAADTERLYWTNTNGVQSSDKSGADLQQLAMATKARGIAVNATHVYWAEARIDGKLGKFDKVTSLGGQLGGALQFPTDVAIDGSFAFVALAGSSSDLDCTSNDGSIIRLDLASGAATTLASNQRCPQSVAVDGNRVYWTNTGSYTGGAYNGDGSVAYAGKDGIEGVRVLANDLALPSGVAFDSSAVYFTEQGLGPAAGSVKKVAK
jgi:hypothetical protein